MRPKPTVDDEFRIYLQNRDTFIFRASKLTSFPEFTNGRDPSLEPYKNPSIEKWEKAIRLFTPKSKITVKFLH